MRVWRDTCRPLSPSTFQYTATASYWSNPTISLPGRESQGGNLQGSTVQSTEQSRKGERIELRVQVNTRDKADPSFQPYLSQPPSFLYPFPDSLVSIISADLLVSAAAPFSPALLHTLLLFSQTPSPSPSPNAQFFLLLGGSLNTISRGDFRRPNISESSSRKGRETSLEMK